VPPETAQLAYARTLRLGLPSSKASDEPSAVIEQTPVDEEEPVVALDEIRAALADHLPATVRGGRLALSRPAAIGLAVLAAAAVALTVSFAWRAHAVPTPLTPTQGVSPAGATTSGTPSASSPTPSPSATTPAFVVVDVAGKVHHAGVVRLPTGSRVVDAIRAAGGALPGVNLTSLNLAAALQDGEQILVGVPGTSPAQVVAPSGVPVSSAPSEPIDLNSATLEQLETLPGIGPSLGQRILDWRTAHGRFTTVDELREVSGIGDARFADLAPRVRV
jgi:competence protein ComEA